MGGVKPENNYRSLVSEIKRPGLPEMNAADMCILDQTDNGD
jgi:hypothetical protein